MVTTPIGNEGIGLRDGIDGFVAESATELAEKIVTLYRDDGLCSQFADCGRSFVGRRFSITKARQILSEILAMDTCDARGDNPKQQPYLVS